MRYIKTYEVFDYDLFEMNRKLVKHIYNFFKIYFNDNLKITINDKHKNNTISTKIGGYSLTELDFLSNDNMIDVSVWKNDILKNNKMVNYDVILYYKHVIKSNSNDSLSEYYNFDGFYITKVSQINNIINELTSENYELYNSSNKYNL